MLDKPLIELRRISLFTTQWFVWHDGSAMTTGIAWSPRLAYRKALQRVQKGPVT